MPSSGSGWEVKNWNGVEAAHSSPWNSIGVNGPARVSSAAQHQLVLVEVPETGSESRSPAARLPTWSWFWLHTTRRQVGIVAVSTGRAVVAPAEGGAGAVVEEAALAHLGQRGERLEVGVVAAGLAGQRDVQGVVEVVAPLRVQAVVRRPRAG